MIRCDMYNWLITKGVVVVMLLTFLHLSLMPVNSVESQEAHVSAASRALMIS